MTCAECLARFSPHHDGALGTVEASEVSAHLSTCAACGREWEAYRRTLRAITGGPAEPPGLASRVDGAWRNPRPERASSGWLPHVILFVIAAAVTIVVLRSC